MKASKGFFLVGEIICLCLSCILLLAAGSAYQSSLRLQERTLQLEDGWQAAQLAAIGEELPERWRAARTISERQGIRLMEVQVYEGVKEQPLCTLLQAAP
ncbi:MAG: hypothetical protein Q4E64_00650 [Phascolarctobacterium sp.]|uniref:hypothetical protein n=1 Tax=Phascolarctobacterium sp. TaxID=2049039 RepID=UPI0026DA8484|nr:hypothetical protein [Phascolarctobacterium sp.]MDO4920329.1 hypothetical protein [Phascolarctobacterium sp.]